MTDINVDELRERAEKQAAGYARMVELNGGIGLLSVREPELYNAMIAWQNASENDQADTVLALLDEVERLRGERDEWKASANEWADALADAADELNEALAVIERIGAMAENDDAAAWDAHQELIRLVARSAPADALREHDAALIESLADVALDESKGIPFDADEDRAIVSTWIAEKARERREGADRG